MYNRRPIGARKLVWVGAIARFLADRGVQPNWISVCSLVFAAISAILLVCSRETHSEQRAILLVVAAVCIPLRAACNMFDGMVAVEFGKATKSGAIFNELPDRFSDVLMLAGAGYAVEAFGYAESLGWAAAVLAVITAFVRTLGAALGVGHDFSGVMAKQQRMLVMTLAILLSAVEGLWDGRGEVIVAGLFLVVVGCVLTVIQRTAHLSRRLEAA